MEVSLSICFATLRESVERDHGDNSKDDMCVVLFWKKGRPNSIEYFEYHAVHPAGWKQEAPWPTFGPEPHFFFRSLSADQHFSTSSL